MGYSCGVPGCTSNYSKKGVKSTNVSVFKFPNDEGLKHKWLDHIARKFNKTMNATRVCVKHFESKHEHTFNIHTNNDGTTYRVKSINNNFHAFSCPLKIFFLITNLHQLTPPFPSPTMILIYQ